MRTNYNDSSNRGGRFQKRSNGGGGGRRPQGKRSPGGHSHSGNGPVNVSGMTSTRNKYLDLAKEALSNGNRVEAENYYQHAEHYSKMLSAAMANRREREESSPDSGQRRYNSGGHGEKSFNNERDGQQENSDNKLSDNQPIQGSGVQPAQEPDNAPIMQ